MKREGLSSREETLPSGDRIRVEDIGGTTYFSAQLRDDREERLEFAEYETKQGDAGNRFRMTLYYKDSYSVSSYPVHQDMIFELVLNSDGTISVYRFKGEQYNRNNIRLTFDYPSQSLPVNIPLLKTSPSKSDNHDEPITLHHEKNDTNEELIELYKYVLRWQSDRIAYCNNHEDYPTVGSRTYPLPSKFSWSGGYRPKSLASIAVDGETKVMEGGWYKYRRNGTKVRKGTVRLDASNPIGQYDLNYEYDLVDPSWAYDSGTMFPPVGTLIINGLWEHPANLGHPNRLMNEWTLNQLTLMTYANTYQHPIANNWIFRPPGWVGTGHGKDENMVLIYSFEPYYSYERYKVNNNDPEDLSLIFRLSYHNETTARKDFIGGNRSVSGYGPYNLVRELAGSSGKFLPQVSAVKFAPKPDHWGISAGKTRPAVGLYRDASISGTFGLPYDGANEDPYFITMDPREDPELEMINSFNQLPVGQQSMIATTYLCIRPWGVPSNSKKIPLWEYSNSGATTMYVAVVYPLYAPTEDFVAQADIWYHAQPVESTCFYGWSHQVKEHIHFVYDPADETKIAYPKNAISPEDTGTQRRKQSSTVMWAGIDGLVEIFDSTDVTPEIYANGQFFNSVFGWATPWKPKTISAPNPNSVGASWYDEHLWAHKESVRLKKAFDDWKNENTKATDDYPEWSFVICAVFDRALLTEEKSFTDNYPDEDANYLYHQIWVINIRTGELWTTQVVLEDRLSPVFDEGSPSFNSWDKHLGVRDFQVREDMFQWFVDSKPFQPNEYYEEVVNG